VRRGYNPLQGPQRSSRSATYGTDTCPLHSLRSPRHAQRGGCVLPPGAREPSYGTWMKPCPLRTHLAATRLLAVSPTSAMATSRGIGHSACVLDPRTGYWLGSGPPSSGAPPSRNPQRRRRGPGSNPRPNDKPSLHLRNRGPPLMGWPLLNRALPLKLGARIPNSLGRSARRCGATPQAHTQSSESLPLPRRCAPLLPRSRGSLPCPDEDSRSVSRPPSRRRQLCRRDLAKFT
jgi:hypothetical protein